MNIRKQTERKKSKEKLNSARHGFKLNKETKMFCRKERTICVMSETSGDLFVN